MSFFSNQYSCRFSCHILKLSGSQHTFSFSIHVHHQQLHCWWDVTQLLFSQPHSNSVTSSASCFLSQLQRWLQHAVSSIQMVYTHRLLQLNYLFPVSFVRLSHTSCTICFRSWIMFAGDTQAFRHIFFLTFNVVKKDGVDLQQLLSLHTCSKQFPHSHFKRQWHRVNHLLLLLVCF